MKRLILAPLLLLLTYSAVAGPKKVLKTIFRPVGDTAVYAKHHPYSFGVHVAVQWGLAFTDTGTTCHNIPNGQEVGPAHFFVGRHPSCPALVSLTTTAMLINSSTEWWLTEHVAKACEREASRPDSRWWKIDAHTHDPKSCSYVIPVLYDIAFAATEGPIIRNNLRLQ